MRTIYLILGAIGSGKSVISDFLLSSQHFDNIEYVCSDLYKSKFFNCDVSLDSRGYRSADELMINRLEQLCGSGQDFALELCPTNKNKVEKIIDLIQKYRYKTIAFYIGVDDVAKNVDRCRLREENGFDHVDQRKIISRFDDAKKGLFSFCYIASIIYFVDNSSEIPKIVAKYWDKKYCVYEQNCSWFTSIESIINKI